MDQTNTATSPQLYTFGQLSFDGNDKVASKALLVLAYLCLEGSRSRAELARLFWSHLEGQCSKRGERKDLKNLGVVRATLKRELGIDIEDAVQLAKVRCDAGLFTEALDEKRDKDALHYYRRSVFLEGVEFCSRLHLSVELLDWLEHQRLLFGQRAQRSLLDMVQDPKQLACTLRLAEDIYEVEREGSHLGLLTQLHGLLTDLGSPLALDAKRRLEQRVETLVDELSAGALKLYLSLSLQETANLAAAQMAVNLSPQNATICLEELRSAGLVRAHQVLSQGVAELYLQQHKSEKIALLRALAEHTPVEQVFGIFKTLYDFSHTFGGLGYWDKAKAAYLHRAMILDSVEAYQELSEVLGQFLKAETDHNRTPNPDTRALHAFAQFNLGQVEQGLKLLEDVPETPEVLVVKATLFTFYGDFQMVTKLNKRIQTTDLNACADWIRAQAANAAGVAAYATGCVLEASDAFTQASALYTLVGKRECALLSQVSRALMLSMNGACEDAQDILHHVVVETKQTRTRLWATANLAFSYSNAEPQKAAELIQTAWAALEDKLSQANLIFAANVSAFLAMVSWRLGNPEARSQLERATELARCSGGHWAFALAFGPLAVLEKNAAKMETALRLLEQTGDYTQLGVYSEQYQALLKELWLDADRQAAPQSLLQISQRLRRCQERRAEMTQSAATALDTLLKRPSCEAARKKLRQYFVTRPSSGFSGHEAPLVPAVPRYEVTR